MNCTIRRWKEMERWTADPVLALVGEHEIALGEVLSPRWEKPDIGLDLGEWQPVTIHFDGTVEARDRQTAFRGAMFAAYPGDLVFSKIDARNGAITVIPPAFQKVVVTSEYPVHTPDGDRVDACTDCDVGWVHFTVSRGAQTVKMRASEVFDPFPDLIAWLEAIAVGVQECAFEVDEEGRGKRLEYRRVCYERCTFTVKDLWGDGSVFLQGGIDPLQLVRDFYEKLRAFARSPGYRKDQWEIDTIGYRLANLSEPPRRCSEVVRQLLTLDRNKLKSTLFELAPSYLITRPDAVDGDMNSVARVDRLLSPDDPYLQKGFVQRPEEWRIPEDYDLWPRAQKLALIVACLSECVSSFDGTRLGDIRSRVIEDWMRKETKTRRRALRQKRLPTAAS